MTPYSEQLADLATTEPELAAQVKGVRNLEAILRWAPGAGIPISGFDLVQQDEYGFDLFLPLPDTRWLVFGIT